MMMRDTPAAFRLFLQHLADLHVLVQQPGVFLAPSANQRLSQVRLMPRRKPDRIDFLTH